MCQQTTASRSRLLSPKKIKDPLLCIHQAFSTQLEREPLLYRTPDRSGKGTQQKEVFHPLGFPIEKTLIIRRDVVMLQLLTSWKTSMDHPPKNYFHLTWSFNNP
jgi:hypothetical protein